MKEIDKILHRSGGTWRNVKPLESQAIKLQKTPDRSAILTVERTNQDDKADSFVELSPAQNITRCVIERLRNAQKYR